MVGALASVTIGSALAIPGISAGRAAADTLPSLTGPAVPAVADLNRDGLPDVVFSNFLLGGRISVFLGKPGGDFHSAVYYATGAQADYVAIADFDHNGVLDLAVTNFSSSDVSIPIGNGDGTFARDRRPGIPAASGCDYRRTCADRAELTTEWHTMWPSEVDPEWWTRGLQISGGSGSK